MKLKTIKTFYDIKADVTRIPDTDTAVFEADEDRFEEIESTLPGYVVESEAEKKPKKKVGSEKEKVNKGGEEGND